MSSGSPNRFSGLSLLSSSMPPRLLIKPCASFEGKNPGAMMLLVMFLGPSSTAKLRARCCFDQQHTLQATLLGLTLAAAFDVEYMMVPCSPTWGTFVPAVELIVMMRAGSSLDEAFSRRGSDLQLSTHATLDEALSLTSEQARRCRER